MPPPTDGRSVALGSSVDALPAGTRVGPGPPPADRCHSPGWSLAEVGQMPAIRLPRQVLTIAGRQHGDAYAERPRDLVSTRRSSPCGLPRVTPRVPGIRAGR